MSFDPGLPDERVNVSGTHPLREAGLLVGGLLAIVVLLAVGSAVAVDWLVPRLPPTLEVKLFSGAWLPLGGDEEEEEEAAADADADPRELRVQTLVDRVARHWPDNPYTFTASVIEDEHANAFALPGGWIVVTTGLLDGVESENELAFVLGHELGHFHNRDHLRGLGRGVALGLVFAAVGATGAGVAGDLASLAAQLAQRSFDRDQESAADRFGVGLLAAEYGHVAGADDFFRNAPDPELPVSDEVAHYLSTHPLHEERIEALAGFTAAQGWSPEGPLVAWE